MTVQPIRPDPRDRLDAARAVLDQIRAERIAAFFAAVIALQEMAGDISDREAGYAPGYAESARRMLERLHTEEMNLRALIERTQTDERLALRRARGHQ